MNMNKHIIVTLVITLLVTTGCTYDFQKQTPILYSGLTVSGEIDNKWHKAEIDEIESIISHKLPIPMYLPYDYEIKDVYYYQESGTTPQVIEVILLISDQPISWVDTKYICRLVLSIGWNSPGLGLKIPAAQYITEIKGKLEQKDNKNILWWESYGGPGSLGSTLRLVANLEFSRDEMINIAASIPTQDNY